jgi:thymidylate kinase
MLVIFEGINGSGKTTYAEELSKITGAKIGKVFRAGNNKLHWGDNSDLKDMLTDLKVPLDTHIDDLFMADFLSTFKVNVILDRTIVSAIAYGRTYGNLDGWYREKNVVGKLINFWSYLIGKCNPPMLYVWLQVSYEALANRCNGRWYPNKLEYNKLSKEYRKLFFRIQFPKIVIPTEYKSVDDGLKRIIGYI